MKKVAVLFGGNSDEKEVSLHTGLAVIEAIKKIMKLYLLIWGMNTLIYIKS